MNKKKRRQKRSYIKHMNQVLIPSIMQKLMAKFFGDVFKKFNWPRESLVVTTKLFFGGMGVNDNGISRKHI